MMLFKLDALVGLAALRMKSYLETFASFFVRSRLAYFLLDSGYLGRLLQSKELKSETRSQLAISAMVYTPRGHVRDLQHAKIIALKFTTETLQSLRGT